MTPSNADKIKATTELLALCNEHHAKLGPYSETTQKLNQLMDAGADPFALVGPDMPIGAALRSASWDVAEVLLNAPAPKEGYPMHLATSAHDLGASLSLKRKIFAATGQFPSVDGKPSAKAEPGLKAFYASHLVSAAEAGDTAKVHAMLSAGCDPDLKAPKYVGGMISGMPVTPLLAATRANHTDAALCLLAFHANPNITDAIGLTPVFHVQRHGNELVIEAMAEAMMMHLEREDAIRAGLTPEPLPAPKEYSVPATPTVAPDNAQTQQPAPVQKERIASATPTTETPAAAPTLAPAAAAKPLIDPVDMAVGQGNEFGKRTIRALAKHGHQKALKIEQLDFNFGV